MNRFVLLIALLVYTPIAFAETGLFESDEILSITIEAPLLAMQRDRDPEPDYRPAKLTYDDAAGEIHSLDIRIRPRGHTRRKPDVCKFPPLRLKFDSDQTIGTVFEGQRRLKVVTHCQTIRKSYQQYVLQEFLAYKTLNLFTEHSFRVRLARVNYVWTDRRQHQLSSYAFFLEDRDRMAARSGMTVQSPERVQRHELDKTAANLVEVFQYLIGNTDWSFLLGRAGNDRCCHNIIMIGSDDRKTYVPVPYDFDFAGIVNTPYAIPGPTTSISNVRIREYRGFCRRTGTLQTTLALFRDRKAAIYQLYKQQHGLRKSTLRRTLKYFDDFYRTIDTPARLERKVVNACR